MTPVHTLTSTKFKTGIQRHLSAPTEPAATFLSNLEVMSGGKAPVSPSRPGREHGDGHTHTGTCVRRRDSTPRSLLTDAGEDVGLRAGVPHGRNGSWREAYVNYGIFTPWDGSRDRAREAARW